jgi:hypothetical protein
LITDCNTSLYTDTTWTDMNLYGTPTVGQTQTIDISHAGCSSTPVIDIFGSGAAYGATWENDPNNRLDWN